MSAAQVAGRILALVAAATVADVRVRLAIGGELAEARAPIPEIAALVGCSTRSLHHALAVREGYADEELAGLLSRARPPSWSALVVASPISPRSRRSAAIDAWLASGAGVRELARAARGAT